MPCTVPRRVSIRCVDAGLRHGIQTTMVRWITILGFLICVWFCTLPTAAQQDRGELQIEVRDPQGATLRLSGELVSQAINFT